MFVVSLLFHYRMDAASVTVTIAIVAPCGLGVLIILPGTIEFRFSRLRLFEHKTVLCAQHGGRINSLCCGKTAD